ncbi:TlpA family protein disulfide reductase [Salinimicrobium oceani]|uniref:Thioredoxin domain-containing protein n=1 Tax=Salinimicrobium oceani TaxID=2722702 RepID=A0ABX1CUI3_9FLAO|nr:hypothetical protein [Salinimicrobium oceani]NJW51427.1 hypothetical protein [Salinimicrobium oceani]
MLIVLFQGCGHTSDNLQKSTYIGGEIINPTTDHVLIRRRGKLLDTVFLDEDNRFSYKIDSAEHGLYLIQHKPETQNLYVAPGDSLLLRVNTLAFDESIHFSGKGNAENNFMSEMFLLDEANSKLLLSFDDYPPAEFQKIADSIHQERLNELQKIAKKKKFSNDFVALAKDVIKYENFDLKERYTYLVTKYFKEYAKQFPENFHDYRKTADFNSEALQCSPGYKRFLENYLINYSLSWCATSGLDSADCSSLTDVENVMARIRKAGELVQLSSLRQSLLKKIAVRGVVMAESRDHIIAIINELRNQKLPEEDIDEMRQLGTIQLAYLPGTSVANVRLLNLEGEFVKINDVLEKPTVIFLWSVYKTGHLEEHKLINQFRKKYPDVDFIGINLDIKEEPAWRVAVRNNNYNTNFEYQLAPTRINKKFFEYYLDKMLFLDPSGEVVNGDTYLTSPRFETTILELLNQ